MRLKLDENLPSEAVEILREAGHDAESVLDERLGGSSDPDIARVCGREDRSLITLDAVSPTSGSIRPSSTAGSSF